MASFHAFTGGLFSSDPDRPLQADAAGLRGLVTDHLAAAFQVSERNPLVGLEGRAVLLRRLGEAMREQPEVFGEDGRPGGLLRHAGQPAAARTCRPPPTSTAHDILSQLLIVAVAASGRPATAIGGVPLGDCWRHAAVRGEGLTDGWVPFHKLSQWLTYSLLEPFEWAGVQRARPRRADRPARVPQRRPADRQRRAAPARRRGCRSAVWQPGDEFIVEWRALTVALLDELAPRVRQLLRPDAKRSCRWPACWKAAPGPPAASWPSACAAACRRCASTATAPFSRRSSSR